MQFKEITGQENVKQQLLQTVAENRISHAQLFLSCDGSGALPLAIAYAQYINCLDKQENDSCGLCSSCRKYERYIHPDLHFSYPFFASKDVKTAVDVLEEWRSMLLADAYFDIDIWRSKLNAENKQANINIAECHDIIKKLSYKAFEAHTKVLIMWLPEYLDKEGNALLKIIEEPPQNTLFILVANNQEQILSTLLSRTQIVKIPKLSHATVENYLMEAHGLPENQATEYSFLADGNLIEAKSLVANIHNDNADKFADWLRMGYGNRVLDLAAFTEQAAGWGRENQKNFLKYGISFLRECSLLLTGADDLVKLPSRVLETAKKLATHVLDLNMADAIISELEQAHYHIERNANPKILFLDVSLQLVKIIKFKTLPKGTQYIYN
ncbi:ATP-binding protein [Pedobacter heparinus]|uniref:DNA polymerase III gamma/tau subunit n=1 Tax=Pedobacter heparinus (strain ATCC 13125 / DSM 2366 / CIP 104194 / JCM 7457 / NBRC 12017 / NCIMB 9290 / NRRL B-14731 / HIM 762-3) TaxID=485917 RepID=C6XXP7_PEDHD|nr:DNA polymerase III subunit delta' [Pedobacter heparinus]ACU02301.1 DNA polymerase III gamma/tau subunit [Pedobacter heparinus DSM 2366]